MKYLLLTLMLVLTGLLGACSNQNSTPDRAQASLANPAANQTSLASPTAPQTAGANFSALEGFVNAIDNGQAQEALDLFNDQALFTEVDRVGLLTSLPHMDNNFTYSGKAEIEGWLKYSIESNLQIAPVEFRVSGDTTILEAQFYYTNQIIGARLEAKTEAGRFNSLTFYINKIQPLD